MICCTLGNESGLYGTLESLLSLWWEKAECPNMKRVKKPAHTKRPKGSYPLPNGNYVTKGRVDCSGRRAIWIEAIHKDPPDYDKLARALLYLAEQLNKEERERNR